MLFLLAVFVSPIAAAICFPNEPVFAMQAFVFPSGYYNQTNVEKAGWRRMNCTGHRCEEFTNLDGIGGYMDSLDALCLTSANCHCSFCALKNTSQCVTHPECSCVSAAHKNDVINDSTRCDMLWCDGFAVAPRRSCNPGWPVS